jgi:hypothetical protein
MSPSARVGRTVWPVNQHTTPAVSLCLLVPHPSEAHQKLNTNPSPRTGSQRPQAPSSVGPSREFPKEVTRSARMSDCSYCLSLIIQYQATPHEPHEPPTPFIPSDQIYDPRYIRLYLPWWTGPGCWISHLIPQSVGGPMRCIGPISSSRNHPRLQSKLTENCLPCSRKLRQPRTSSEHGALEPRGGKAVVTR